MSKQKRHPASKQTKQDKRGKRFNGNQKKEAPDMSTDIDKPGSNDPMWYAINSSMLTNAANLNFYNPLGRGIALGRTNANPFYIPGLMTFDVVPTITPSHDASSAINTAAFNLYSEVRYKNSGKTNYESPDLMMYVLAANELYSAYTWLVRLYGLAGSYSALNRYLPRLLIQANGVDPDSFITELANFRAMMDIWAAKINSMCVPNVMPLTAKRIWIYSNVYRDSPNLKSQLYMFKPKCFLKYEGYTDKRGGRLVPVYMPTGADSSSLWSVQDIYNFMESMINPLIGDEDMNIMSGDILKKFENNIVRLGNVPADFTVYPEYNAEVLTQINNADILSEANFGDDTWNIYQDPGTNPDSPPIILYQPKFDCPTIEQVPDLPKHFVWDLKHLINHPSESPTPGDVMVATRLMFRMATPTSLTGGQPVNIESCGSEIIVGARMWGGQPLSNGLYDSTSFDKSGWLPGSISGQLPDYFASEISFFESHPPMWANDGVIGPRVWDIENYAVLDNDDLDVMHDVAMMSLLGIADQATSYR